MEPNNLVRRRRRIIIRTWMFVLLLVVITLNSSSSASGIAVVDSNEVFSPCGDTTVQRWDGFTFGLAFAAKDMLAPPNKPQFSPCDPRLQLSQPGGAELAVFRPRVDEISLLTLNTTTFNPNKPGGVYMVAFAGSKYAARSFPIFVANETKTVTSFALVLEFQKGILFNLYWKTFGCDPSCEVNGGVCVEKQSCAVAITKCKSKGGSVDCTVGVQLAFSGTDRNQEVLNSWYELNNLRTFSLAHLFGGSPAIAR